MVVRRRGAGTGGSRGFPPAAKAATTAQDGKGATPEAGEDGKPDAETPTLGALLLPLLIVRALPSAMMNGTHDCDEAYNYWEPLAKVAGRETAMQTWEYAPEHALRSYLFLWLAGWPATVATHRAGFHLTRAWLAVLAALAEAYLASACYRRFGHRVGRVTHFLLLISGGLYTATTQLLPGTLTALGMTLAAAFAIDQRPLGVIVAVASGAVLGASLGHPPPSPLPRFFCTCEEEIVVYRPSQNRALGSEPIHVDYGHRHTALAKLSTSANHCPPRQPFHPPAQSFL